MNTIFCEKKSYREEASLLKAHLALIFAFSIITFGFLFEIRRMQKNIAKTVHPQLNRTNHPHKSCVVQQQQKERPQN